MAVAITTRAPQLRFHPTVFHPFPTDKRKIPMSHMTSTSASSLPSMLRVADGKMTLGSRQSAVDTVLKIDREYLMERDAEHDGLDNLRVRTESGDALMVSGRGFEHLNIKLGNEIEVKGVKGRVTWKNDEANSKTEIRWTRGLAAFQGTALGAIMVGPIFGYIAGGPSGSSVPIVVVWGLTIVAMGAMGYFMSKPVANPDLLKLWGKEV